MNSMALTLACISIVAHCSYINAYMHFVDYMYAVLAQREARERDCKKTPNSKLPPLLYSTLDKVQEMLEVTLLYILCGILYSIHSSIGMFFSTC
jgi:hypothetical protein